MTTSTTLISWPGQAEVDAEHHDGTTYVTLQDGDHRLTMTLREGQAEQVGMAVVHAADPLAGLLTPAMVARFIAAHNPVAVGEVHAAVCALLGQRVGGRLWQAGRLLHERAVSE